MAVLPVRVGIGSAAIAAEATANAAAAKKIERTI
jgi:hypothetical protein